MITSTQSHKVAYPKQQCRENNKHYNNEKNKQTNKLITAEFYSRNKLNKKLHFSSYKGMRHQGR